MSKSRARLLAELLNAAGRVKKDKSDLAGADSIIDLDTLPTITNAKLENSSISVAGHSVSLGGSVSLDTADISEHTDYPYFTNARARGAISVSGDLAYNSSTGVISFTERTDAEVRGLVSAGGNLSYNSTTGVFSYTTPTTIASLSNHDTDDLAEGTNLYYTNARARAAVSASTGSAGYTSSTGVFTIPSTSDHITEGSNQFFTNARARSAISASGSLSYNSSTGVISYTQPTNISTFTNDSSYITNATASLNASKITGGTLNFARIPIPVNGDWWNNGYVRVQTDGVMEVGKYLDFHTADSGGGTDYDVRITASSGAIDIDGDLTVDAITASGAVTWSGGSSTNANTAYGWGNHASQGYATLASPALTGTPTAPTASAGTNTTQIATTAFVGTAVSNLVDSAPGTLNTLNELAAALGDDANFSTTVTNSIATKLPLAGGTMTGAINMGSNNLSGINNATAVSFLSTNGYWVGGTQRINGSGDLVNIDDITATGLTTLGRTASDRGAISDTNTALIATSRGVAHTDSQTNVLRLQRDGTSGVVYAGLADIDLERWESSGVFSRTAMHFKLGHGNLSPVSDANIPTVMTLRSNGMIGIGTTAPSKPLHVKTSLNEGIFLEGTSNGVWMDVQSNGSELWSMGADTSGWAVYNRTDSAYQLRVENAGDVDIVSGGLKVGAVTTIDSSRNISSNSVTVASGHNVHLINGNVTIGDYSNTNTGTLFLRGSTANKQAALKATNGNLHIDCNAGNNTYINYYTGSGIYFGSGAGGVVAVMGPDGDLWKGSADNSGSKYWHASNGGSGSGLDADTLDGVQGSSFLRSDASDTVSGTLTFGSGSGFDLATFDIYGSMRVIRNNKSGSDGMYIGYLNSNSGLTRIFGGGQGSGGIYISGSGANDIKYANTSVFWHAGNDGGGSGLDADTLDGVQGASFLRSDADDSMTGNITFSQPKGLIFANGQQIKDNGGGGLVISSSYQINLNQSTGLTTNGNTIWHSGNDGASSGLDADLIDGMHRYNHHGVGELQTIEINGDEDKYYPVVITGGSTINSEFEIYRGFNELAPASWNSSTHQGGLTFRYRITGSAGWGGYPTQIHIYEAGEVYTTVLGGIAYTAHSMKHVVWLRGGGTTGARYHIFSRSDFDVAIYDDTSSGYTSGSGWLSYDSTNNAYDTYVDYRTLAQRNAAMEGEIYNNMSVSYSNARTHSVLSGTGPGKTFWNTGNDGSGSGLDADLLDGVQAASFLRSDASDTATGALTFSGTILSNGHSSGSNWMPFSDGNFYIRAPSTFFEGNVEFNNETRVVTGSIAASNTTKGLMFDGNYETGQYRHRFRKQDLGAGIPLFIDYAHSTANSYSQVVSFGGPGSNYNEFTVYGDQDVQGQLVINNNIPSPANYYNGLQVEVRATSGTAGIGLHRNGYSHVGIYTNATNRLDFDFNSGDVIMNYNAGTLWGSGNDGSGSGLDADLLDGKNSTDFTYYRGMVSGDWDTMFTTGTGKTLTSGLYEVHNISNTDTNYPVGAYTYGGVFAWYLNNSTFKLYAPHIGTLWYQTGWGNDEYSGWRKIWDNGNDGSGSGLDADLLDGIQGSAFLRTDITQSPTNVINLRAGGNHLGNHEFAANTNQTAYSNSSIELREANYGGSSSYSAPRISFHWGGVVASSIAINTSGDILIQNNPGTGYENLWAANIYSNNNLVWHAGNDGSGSGLDADLLDGQQGSYYYAASNPSGYITSSGTASQSHMVSGNAFATTSSPGSVLEYQQAASITDTKLAPSTNWYNSIRMGHGNPYSYYSNTIAVRMTGGGEGTLYTQAISNNNALGWNKHWHNNNDGSGSGLDADLLDGIDSGSFFRSDANDTATGQYTFTKTDDHAIQIGTIRGRAVGSQGGQFIQLYERVNIGGPSGWGDASTTAAPSYGLSTYGGASLATHTGAVTISGNTAWHAGNDGSGSGLDADLLDGNDSTAFPKLAATNTWGNNAINYFRVERGGYSGSINTANLQAYTTGANSAFMSFHRSGAYAVNFGLDADNVLRIGGWSASANRWVLDMSGNMTAAGNVTAYSDIRLKENIEVIPNALEKVKQIRGVTFTRNDQENKEARHTGVIAQEVEKVLPEVISEDNLGIKNVAYGNMVGLLIEAVKELKQEVDDLKAQLKEK